MGNAKLDLVHRKITGKQKILTTSAKSKIMVRKHGLFQFLLQGFSPQVHGLIFMYLYFVHVSVLSGLSAIN